MNDFCIFGVASIIQRIIDKKKHILIQRRQKGGDSPETGLIEIPCGKVKKQESLFECIYKKVQIETGLNITKIYGKNSFENKSINGYNVINYIPFFSSQNIEKNYPIVLETFICEADGEPFVESKDAKDIHWISLEDLQQLLLENELLFYPMILMPLKHFIKMELNISTW